MRSDLDRREGELVSDRAAEWFVRLHGDPSPGQRRDYWRWLRKSQEHVTAALDIGRIYGLLSRMKLPPSIDDPDPPSNVVELFPDKRREWRTVMRVRRQSGRPWMIAALALTVVLAGVLTLAATAWFNSAIETAPGEWRVQVLADGSTVRIGPRSRMRVKFDDRQRVIRLMSGDVMFEVAKDARRPFIVDTGLGTARAVGTAFGVTRVDDWMVVTVTEGVVAVARGSAPPVRTQAVARSANQSAEPVAVAVSAGQQVDMSSVRLHPVRQVDVERELAWVHGKLIFEDQTIGEAVYEFNRRNRLQIEVRGRELAARPVEGVFDAADPRSFAEFLELAGSIEVAQDRPNVLRLEAREDHEAAALQAETP